MKHQTYVMTPSILSFKDYINSFVFSKNAVLVDGWGWYIDIEKYTNKLPMQLAKYHKYGKKTDQYIDYQPQIVKMSSHKSIRNLNELYMSEDEYNRKLFNQDLILCINAIGLISLVVIYYTIIIR